MNSTQPSVSLVKLQNVSKYFGEGAARVDAPRDVSLEVFPGQVVGLHGPSGSGKTTLLNAVGCILQPSSGPISLEGDVVYDGRWLRSDLRKPRQEKIGFQFFSSITLSPS